MLADLQPQRKGEEDALHAGRKRGLDAEPGRERGDPEQPRPEQRRDLLAGPPVLAHAQHAHAGQARGEQSPHPRGPAELTALEQRVDDGDERAGQQDRAGQVGPAGGGVAGLGDDSGAGDQRAGGHRHVDEEDRAPAPAEQVHFGQHAAEDQANRGRKTEHRPIDAERLAPLPCREDGPEGGEHLRRHGGRGGALDDTGGDQLRAGPR